MENKSRNYKIPFICSLGACLEYFDFALFIFLLDPLRIVFFPEKENDLGFFLILVIFSSGYLMRPSGGFFFGHFGDKFGRKRAFQLSVTLMAIASIIIAFLPSATVAGGIAPIFLFMVRMLQGFSVGGEIPGASVYASEFFSERRGLVIGLIFLGITWGNILAIGLIGFIRLFMTSSEFLAYGWRICFLVGGLVGFLAFQLRMRFSETPVFREFKANKLKIPAQVLFNKSWKDVISGFFSVGTTATSLFILVRLPEYLQDFIGVQFENIQVFSLFTFVVLGFGVVFFGFISDYISRKILMLVGSLLVILVSFFVLSFLDKGSSIGMVYLMTGILAFTLSIPNGVYACYILEKFPTLYRLSGLSICYNLGYAIFEGIFPLIITLVLTNNPSIVTVAYFISIPALLSFLSSFFSNDYSKRHLKF
ncbi:MAG: MFS transporter [Hyphomicrobiales bacterium]